MSTGSTLQTMKTPHEKANLADAKAAYWLAQANQLQEAGKDDSKAYAKAQYWLDRANKLRGFS